MRKIFFEKLLATIKKHNMLSDGDSVIIGLSGGADSVALLYSLHFLKEKYNLTLYCLHINHGIRGKVADSDLEFSERISKRFEIPFHSEFIDIPLIAKEQNLSHETAGRQARYKIFLKYSKLLNANKIATGHHSDDQAETVLMRIIRGTGSFGFKGILPVRENFYIRPLLGVSKQEILDLLKDENIPFKTDLTNFDNYYFRNKVRNELFPILKTLNPKIKKRLCVMREILSDENDFLAQESSRLFSSIAKIDSGEVFFNIEQIKPHHIAMQRLLIKKALTKVLQIDTDIDFNLIESGVLCLNYKSFCKSISIGNLIFAKDKYRFQICKQTKNKETQTISYKIDGTGEHTLPFFGLTLKIEYMDPSANTKQGDQSKAFFDSNKVSFPLQVRTRAEGDVFKPLGLNGKKKLKKFFIDEKINQNDRDKTPIITDFSGNIMWVCPIRISSLFKTDRSTKKILKITAIKG